MKFDNMVALQSSIVCCIFFDIFRASLLYPMRKGFSIVVSYEKLPLATKDRRCTFSLNELTRPASGIS